MGQFPARIFAFKNKCPGIATARHLVISRGARVSGGARSTNAPYTHLCTYVATWTESYAWAAEAVGTGRTALPEPPGPASTHPHRHSAHMLVLPGRRSANLKQTREPIPTEHREMPRLQLPRVCVFMVRVVDHSVCAGERSCSCGMGRRVTSLMLHVRFWAYNWLVSMGVTDVRRRQLLHPAEQRQQRNVVAPTKRQFAFENLARSSECVHRASDHTVQACYEIAANGTDRRRWSHAHELRLKTRSKSWSSAPSLFGATAAAPAHSASKASSVSAEEEEAGLKKSTVELMRMLPLDGQFQL